MTTYNEYARRFYQRDVQRWKWNGTVNTVADVSFACADMFRVGRGIGYAMYAPDENEYGRGAAVAMDVVRAAGLFSTLAAPIAKPASFGTEYKFGDNFRIAPFGNRRGHPVGEWPHYHRGIPDPKRPGHSLPGQGKGQHRPWEGGW